MFGIHQPKETSGIYVASLELQSVEGDAGSAAGGSCACVRFLGDFELWAS